MIRFDDDASRLAEHDVEGLFDGWTARPSPAARVTLLRKAHAVELAYEDDMLVGFASAISDGMFWAYITLLEVVPSHRRRGIGTALMTRMLERYRGMYGIDLNCDDALAGFYERLGMTRLSGMVIRDHGVLR